jgi:Distinct helicase family with a unique C-terminal domain including a metal-binding cysteine cluster
MEGIIATRQLLEELGLDVIYTESKEPRSAQMRYAENLTPDIQSIIREMFPSGLYQHQAKAIDCACAGENIVICTGTASGKTLAFAVPVLQKLLQDSKARALFFYPTKALSGDQRSKLEKLAYLFGLQGCVYSFDGDTPFNLRKEAIRKGRILLCTPDVLHATMLRLSNERDYQEFFKHLTHVVLDECHIYSGAFGSNMSYLMRRLRQVCRRLDNEPHFLAASATSKDPQGHLEKLVGVPFRVIEEEENGSPSGGRDFYIAVSHTISEEQAIIELIAQLISRQKRFIVFSHTRKVTEQVYMGLVDQFPEVEGKVMPYRSGFEQKDRQSIERALREEILNGVISTSALELGVDLPEMEYCILIGIPSTAMSLWQRVGRVGRSPESCGQVIIIPSTNSIDDYYRLHTEKLLTRELEDLVIHLDNWQLILFHFACARVESGNHEHPNLYPEIFGQDFAQLADKIEDSDITDEILITPEPHLAIGIRGIDDKTYEIFTSGGEKRLGTIAYSQILREAYPQAVYRHMGEAYRVEWLNSKHYTIRVKREERNLATSPIGYIVVKERINNGTIFRRQKWGNSLEMLHTTMTVTTVTSGYRERRNGEWINQEKYPSPLQRRVISEGVWFKFGPEFGAIKKNALNALAHALSNIYSICFPCDAAEIATHCVVNSKDNFSRLYIFDTTSGGLGVTSGVFDHFLELLDPVQERLAYCDHCDTEPELFDSGCPSCIQIPRWFEDNEHLSKAQALELLSQIRKVIETNMPELIISEVFQGRQEGSLTAVSSLNKLNGEVALEDIKRSALLYSNGSIIALPSGQQGKILSWKMDKNQVTYETELTNGKTIGLRNTGNNITLIQGEETFLCLDCGSDGIDKSEYICPACGASLQ